MAIAPGVVLGDRFEVVGELGRGGTATVWLARDLKQDRDVALKTMHPHLADRPTTAHRLEREVQAAAKVQHPAALVPDELHNFDGTHVLSMPLHEGQSLAEHVANNGAWTADALKQLGKRLGEVLAVAHRAGVVHRDVTPQNVMVDPQGVAVLTDFGLARVDGRHTRAATTSLLGTPGYAAPEIYEGGAVGPAVDLYGLGAVLYLAATGTAPFAADTPTAILQRQLDGRFLSLAEARPDLPTSFARTVDALLSPDPSDRPTTAREVVDLVEGKLSSVHLERQKTEALGLDPSARLGRAHLPQGAYRVVVSEKSDDGHRRRILRAGAQGKRDGLGLAMLRFIEDKVRDYIEAPRQLAPEDQLVGAVARAASLPRDALTVPVNLYEAHFRLVEGVDRAVAEQFCVEADEAGFDAEIEATTAIRKGFDGSAIFVAIMASFASLILFFVAASAGSMLGVISSMAFMAAFWGWGVSQRTELPSRASDWPLAFGPDLRAHLKPEFAGLLPPPAIDGAVESAPAPEPTPASRRDSEVLLGRVLARVQGFRDDLSVGSSAFTPDMVADLQRGADELESEARRLAARLDTIATASAGVASEAALEAQVDQVMGRIRRLETLQRAGKSVTDGEIERLKKAVDAHLAELDQAETFESRRVRTAARLLELGALASELRRELFEQTIDETQPLGDVVGRMRAEVAAAKQTSAEMDALERSRRSLKSLQRQR